MSTMQYLSRGKYSSDIIFHCPKSSLPVDIGTVFSDAGYKNVFTMESYREQRSSFGTVRIEN